MKTTSLHQRHFSLLAAYEKKALDDGFLPDECQLRCLQRLESLRLELIKSQVVPRGLYMYGGVGTGKTMMLDLFHEEVKKAGISSRRQHFHEFLQDVHRRLHELRGRVGPMRGLLARCAEEFRQEFPVLAFDEAHVLNVGDALMLRSFFEAYFKAGGLMVATSNVAPDDLYASGINREVFLPFLDALREKCDFFEMEGRHDYRTKASESGRARGAYIRRRAQQKKSEVTPDEFPGLRKALGIEKDTTATRATAVDIDVGFGRNFRCEQLWNYGSDRNVLQFSFDELCRTATGPSEWVGLANFADGILVTDVPRFPVHDEDAARRFITFVDIIYDRQKFLVVTAEAGPDEIFSELIEKYGGGQCTQKPQSQRATASSDAKMKMPSHGLASGRHGVVFQRPKQLHYGSSGAYVTTATAGTEDDAPVGRATSLTRTGGRAEHGIGSQDRVMQGVVEEDSEWVEWSATGLKDASLFDLSPSNTDSQVNDKLLPFRRCASRLRQMLTH